MPKKLKRCKSKCVGTRSKTCPRRQRCSSRRNSSTNRCRVSKKCADKVKRSLKRNSKRKYSRHSRSKRHKREYVYSSMSSNRRHSRSKRRNSRRKREYVYSPMSSSTSPIFVASPIQRKRVSPSRRGPQKRSTFAYSMPRSRPRPEYYFETPEGYIPLDLSPAGTPRNMDECMRRYCKDETDWNTCYKKRALELHPDKNPNNPAATHNFQQLSRCHEMHKRE